MADVLAIFIGDRYGVGPEIVARLLAESRIPTDVRIVAVGDRAVFARGRAAVGAGGPYPTVASLAEARGANEPWVFLHRPFAAEVAPVGRVSAESGREALDTFAFLLDAAKQGAVNGIAYAPLNKQSLHLGGHDGAEELDFFRKRLGHEGPAGEVNILDRLWTSRVTSHVPLRAVGDLITRDKVRGAIALIAEAMKRSGRDNPHIGVAALNPHAGEGGAFGREEIDVIAPAIAEARAAGFNVDGPWPADTIFPLAEARGIDGVVTMFHDQGQIALKLLGLGRGITLHAGLPVPIATPSHGTAFDIVGTGKARIDGLAATVALVARMMSSDGTRNVPHPGVPAKAGTQ
jgi:4-hydroxythreonine-4-phosphate dehydrogenase